MEKETANLLEKEINERGYVRTWNKYCQKDAMIANLFAILSLTCIIIAIIIGASFIIHIIVRGIQLSDSITMIAEFKSKTLTFTASISIFISLGNIYDATGDCCELFDCSQWVIRNKFDLPDYFTEPSRSRLKTQYFKHDVKLSYHVLYPNKITKTIITDLTICFLSVVLTVITGLLTAPAINQFFILEGTEFFDLYSAIGFLSGALATIGFTVAINKLYENALKKRYDNAVLHTKSGIDAIPLT